MSRAINTDYIPCDCPIFISKRSECKQVELSNAFIPACFYF